MVKSGDIVRVKVLDVDIPRKRISLTLRLDDEATPAAGGRGAAAPANPRGDQRGDRRGGWPVRGGQRGGGSGGWWRWPQRGGQPGNPRSGQRSAGAGRHRAGRTHCVAPATARA